LTRPGGFPPGRAHSSMSGKQVPSDLSTLNSLGGNRAAHLGHGRGRRVGRSRAVGGRTAGRLGTAGRLAAAVAGSATRLAATSTGVAGRLAAAGTAAARLPALLRGVERLEKVTDRRALLAAAGATARHTGVASGLAAASTGVAGRLTAAVAGVASGLAAASTSVAGRLTAAIAAAAPVLPLALLEQTLQPTEQVVLAALPHAAAAGVDTAHTGVAGRLAATSTGIAAGLAAASTGIAAGLTAASTSIAAGLTARGTTLTAEHPVKELETEGLATNGHAEDQRAEKHHTLHRATSPLLVDHRCVRPARDAVTPRL